MNSYEEDIIILLRRICALVYPNDFDPVYDIDIDRVINTMDNVENGNLELLTSLEELVVALNYFHYCKKYGEKSFEHKSFDELLIDINCICLKVRKECAKYHFKIDKELNTLINGKY